MVNHPYSIETNANFTNEKIISSSEYLDQRSIRVTGEHKCDITTHGTTLVGNKAIHCLRFSSHVLGSQHPGDMRKQRKCLHAVGILQVK